MSGEEWILVASVSAPYLKTTTALSRQTTVGEEKGYPPTKSPGGRVKFRPGATLKSLRRGIMNACPSPGRTALSGLPHSDVKECSGGAHLKLITGS
jgi:hypothetical protein